MIYRSIPDDGSMGAAWARVFSVVVTGALIILLAIKYSTTTIAECSEQMESHVAQNTILKNDQASIS